MSSKSKYIVQVLQEQCNFSDLTVIYNGDQADNTDLSNRKGSPPRRPRLQLHFVCKAITSASQRSHAWPAVVTLSRRPWTTHAPPCIAQVQVNSVSHSRIRRIKGADDGRARLPVQHAVTQQQAGRRSQCGGRKFILHCRPPWVRTRRQASHAAPSAQWGTCWRRRLPSAMRRCTQSKHRIGGIVTQRRFL